MAGAAAASPDAVAGRVYGEARILGLGHRRERETTSYTPPMARTLFAAALCGALGCATGHSGTGHSSVAGNQKCPPPFPSDPDSSIAVAPGLRIRGAKPQVAPRAHIDPDAVKRAVRAHADEVRACYVRQLAVEPTLEGTLYLAWGVNEVGRAGSAVATQQTTLGSAAVARCIIALIPTWQFPPTRDCGVAEVVHSWTFAPRRDR